MRLFYLIGLFCVFNIAVCQMMLGQNGLSLPPINLMAIYRILRRTWKSYFGEKLISRTAKSGTPVPYPEPDALEDLKQKIVKACSNDLELDCKNRTLESIVTESNISIDDKQLLLLLEKKDILANIGIKDRSVEENKVEDRTELQALPKTPSFLPEPLRGNAWVLSYLGLNAALLTFYLVLAAPYYFTGETVGTQYIFLDEDDLKDSEEDEDEDEDEDEEEDEEDDSKKRSSEEQEEDEEEDAEDEAEDAEDEAEMMMQFMMDDEDSEEISSYMSYSGENRGKQMDSKASKEKDDEKEGSVEDEETMTKDGKKSKSKKKQQKDKKEKEGEKMKEDDMDEEEMDEKEEDDKTKDEEENDEEQSSYLSYKGQNLQKHNLRGRQKTKSAKKPNQSDESSKETSTDSKEPMIEKDQGPNKDEKENGEDKENGSEKQSSYLSYDGQTQPKHTLRTRQRATTKQPKRQKQEKKDMERQEQEKKEMNSQQQEKKVMEKQKEKTTMQKEQKQSEESSYLNYEGGQFLNGKESPQKPTEDKSESIEESSYLSYEKPITGRLSQRLRRSITNLRTDTRGRGYYKKNKRHRKESKASKRVLCLEEVFVDIQSLLEQLWQQVVYFYRFSNTLTEEKNYSLTSKAN